MSESAIPLEELLKHSEWVQALARSLVKEAADAEDLAQEVWQAALHRGPTDSRNLRGWFRTVARRLAELGRRRRHEAAQREQAVAFREPLPATEDLVAKASMQREVTAHVLASPESYRRVILLRFWEGLAPREIAERDGVPLATIKTRLQRARAQLRDRLESEYGGEGQWCLALSPLLESSPSQSGDGFSSRQGSQQWVGEHGARTIVIGGTFVVVIVTVAVMARRFADPIVVEPVRNVAESQASRGTEAASPMAGDSRSGGRSREPADSMTRTMSGSPMDPATPNDSEPDAVAMTAARLVDSFGAPLSGFRLRRRGLHTVRWQGGDPIWLGNDITTLRLTLEEQFRWRTDPDAIARLAKAQAHPEEWLAVLQGTSIPERELHSDSSGRLAWSETEEVEVVEPGWTLIATGVAAGSEDRVLVAAPANDLSGQVVDLAGNPVEGATVTWEPDLLPSLLGECQSVEPPPCRSDSSGRFVLRSVPCHRGSRWRVTSDRHQPWSGPVPTWAATDLRIELTPWSASSPTIRGRVVDAAGRPLSTAQVHWDPFHESVNESGEFQLPARQRTTAPLLVIAPHHLPRRLSSLTVGKRDLDLGTLVLEPGGRTLSGRVVDASGRSLSGLRIGLANPTPIEGILTSLEQEVGDRDLTVVTSAEGGFGLSGLLSESVSLLIFQPTTGRLQVTEPLVVREPRLLEFRPEEPATVNGRISGGNHTTIHVTTGFDWLLGANGRGSIHETWSRVSVRPDGTFTLSSVPRSGWIAVHGVVGTRRFFVAEWDLSHEVILEFP